jgi:hypothetical protein
MVTYFHIERIEMKALVIGFGSIGSQHVAQLEDRGIDYHTVSKHLDRKGNYQSLDLVDDLTMYTHIFICNETSLHYDTYKQLCDSSFKGLIFIEKPTHFPPGAHLRESVYVGYDLRFSAVLDYVHQNLESLGDIYYVNVYCGQHLSQWRDRDYKESYSSSVRSGGGVVNDLSHEIDYLQLLFGELSPEYCSLSNEFLDIDTESLAHIVFKTGGASVNCTLNYLDIYPSRTFDIRGTKGFIAGDFIANTVCHNNLVLDFPAKELIKELHDDIWSGLEIVATLDESLIVDKLIGKLYEIA